MLEQFQADLKDAMRAKEETRKLTLRALITAFKNAAIEKRADLTDADAIDILSREAKKRREGAEGFRSGDREEDALKEEAELAIIQTYLPTQLTEDDVRAFARDAIAALGAADAGKVMGQVMPHIKGKFDGKLASGLIRDELAKAKA